MATVALTKLWKDEQDVIRSRSGLYEMDVSSCRILPISCIYNQSPTKGMLHAITQATADKD